MSKRRSSGWHRYGAQESPEEMRAYTPFERVLIRIGLALTAAAAALFISGISLQNMLFGIDLYLGANQIATLENSTGEVKQKRIRSPEFREIQTPGAVYNGDALTTGADSSARVLLFDGGSVELESDSMIKISFVAKSAVGVLFSKTARVEVIAGEVRTHAKQTPMIIRNRDKEYLSFVGERRDTKVKSERIMPTKVLLPETDVPVLRPIPRAGGSLPVESSDSAANKNPVDPYSPLFHAKRPDLAVIENFPIFPAAPLVTESPQVADPPENP